MHIINKKFKTKSKKFELKQFRINKGERRMSEQTDNLNQTSYTIKLIFKRQGQSNQRIKDAIKQTILVNNDITTAPVLAHFKDVYCFCNHKCILRGQNHSSKY